MNLFNIFEDTVDVDLDFLQGASIALTIALIILVAFAVIIAIAALVANIILFFKYLKFNKMVTKCGKAGKDVARELLDKNGLEKIKVVKASIFTAFTVGNSYSHFWKRIRLRGLIYKKNSITSVAMAGEKVGLALLDKEGDKDMKKRIWLAPLVGVAPFLFLLIVLVSLVLDILFFNLNGIPTIIGSCVSVLFYVWMFGIQLTQYKTEIKAQERAIPMLLDGNYIDNSEVPAVKELYSIYKVTYIIAAIQAFVQMILEIIKLLLKILEQANGFKK